jgi:lipopolysaccharide/colanic/teichoic acid biosynthesis glycosyltransferase
VEAHELTTEAMKSNAQRAAAAESPLRRGIDLVLAVLLVILLAPLLIAIAIAIRVDSPGPALFRQRRVGLRGREFTVFKFRSMSAEADQDAHREYVTALIAGDEEANGDGGQDLYKLTSDDRVTRTGHWIRRWSLDELPQLFNVIAGDMSLVGPRPAIPYEVEEYPRWYMRRFDVKPGLTGLWQVNGRNERTYEEMVRLDIEYAERSSLLLDLSILARTPLTVISRKGVS